MSLRVILVKNNENTTTSNKVTTNSDYVTTDDSLDVDKLKNLGFGGAGSITGGGDGTHLGEGGSGKGAGVKVY